MCKSAYDVRFETKHISLRLDFNIRRRARQYILYIFVQTDEKNLLFYHSQKNKENVAFYGKTGDFSVFMIWANGWFDLTKKYAALRRIFVFCFEISFEIEIFLSVDLTASGLSSDNERDAEMIVRKLGYASSARCSGEKTDLHKIRLVNVLDGDSLLADRSCESVESDRTAAVEFDNGFKHSSIYALKTELVDL